jgi:hypothetical protein
MATLSVRKGSCSVPSGPGCRGSKTGRQSLALPLAQCESLQPFGLAAVQHDLSPLELERALRQIGVYEVGNGKGGHAAAQIGTRPMDACCP